MPVLLCSAQHLPFILRLRMPSRSPCLPDLLPQPNLLLLLLQGMMKGQELSEAYASADIFVMPSETETLGFVVLEAMASGVAVVAVGAGGLVDIVQPGKTGLMFKPGDYAQAAQFVKQLIQDPELRAKIAHQARREVELFGWSAATRVLREQQYARAVKLSIGKRRFWLLAMRIGVTRLFRALLGFIAAAWSQLVRSMDYARAYRTAGAANLA